MKEDSTGILVKILLDSNFKLSLEVSPFIIGPLGIALVIYLLYKTFSSGWKLRDFEIDEAEFGIGDHKVKLKPNDTDKQIAYRIWVELSTRKIGLPIDLEDDVISDIYDSWYSFFSVTRDLIKDVPVSRFQRKDTEKIIRLSIDVLNIGLRPHLTKWQARYRRWYEAELAKSESVELEPQQIQKAYPHIEKLEADLLLVNKRLIGYRTKMYELISSVET
ncbi:hypothetical protein [Acaryochloris sp. CCMEE 5410]|uniref:hypothetical protein n=1 Tax=Acaryochloris sp. CCMEE 5410 TaxID=310037 RepID=UPI0002484DB0|nr:hypothetical protein [Acaryochloris sp. CCMEE 5410]KAI9131138.1 hypothetical protein ON05_026075 [Acaryochloris sp. CCMEE 5410]